MRFHLTFQIVVLVVVMTLLTARVGQFTHEALFAPIQNFLSQKDQIAGDGVKKAPVFCKTKTLPELFSPMENPKLLPPSPSNTSVSRTSFSGRAPEGICKEIFIPPEVLG